MGKWGDRVGTCCGFCGAEYSLLKSRVDQDRGKYCSRDCYHDWKSAQKPRRECRWCGTWFFRAHNANPDQEYCSKPCARFAYYWRSPTHKTVHESVRESRAIREARQNRVPCRVCGRKINAAYGRDICSQRCGYMVQRSKQIESRSCVICGTEFVPDPGTPWSTCGPRCHEERTSRERRKIKATRRARKRDAFVEHVDAAVVFARDANRCGICGEKVDQRCRVPHPNAPVVDHIIPLAKGGEHSYRNVQCAHFSCNSHKGDGVAGSQLRLVG